jgi:MFS family permease
MAPIALAFAVLELTGSKTDLGLVLAAQALPQVIFLLVGGVWSDRLPRHHVMVASNVLSGVSQAALAVLLLSGRAAIWQLALLAAVNGVTSAFLLPRLAGHRPADRVGAGPPAGECAAPPGHEHDSHLRDRIGRPARRGNRPRIRARVRLRQLLRRRGRARPMRLPAGLRLEGSSFLAELREGWREFSSRTWLWVIVVQFSIFNAVQQTRNVLGPVVAQQGLGGAAGWGLIAASFSLGLVLGGIVLLRVRPQRLLVVATLCVLLATPLLAALAVPLQLAAVCLLALVAGIGLEVFGVMWDTSLQQEVPQDRLSRVYSYDALGSFVFIPIGLAIVGPVAEVLGTSETLWLAFGNNTVVTVAVLAVPDVRRLRRRPLSQADQPAVEGAPA